MRAVRIAVETMAKAWLAISGRRTAGVVKIGAIRTVSTRLVPAAFAALTARFPDLAFELSVGGSERLMSDVAAGRLDAALVADHVGVPTCLAWSQVLTEPLFLIAPPAEAWRDDRAPLSEVAFVRHATDVPLARQIDTDLSGLSLAPRDVVVANTMPAVVAMVAAGLGVAIVPRIAALALASGTAHRCLFRDGAITCRIGLVQRQVASRTRLLARLCDALCAGVRADEGAL